MPTPPDPSREAAIRLLEETCQYLQTDSNSTRLASVLQAFDGSFFVKDSGGRLAFASPALASLFPTISDPTGMLEHEFMPDGVRALTQRADELVLSQRRIVSFSFQLTENATERHFHTQRVPLVSSQQQVVGMFGVFFQIDDKPEKSRQWPDGVVGLDELQILEEREIELAQLLSHGAVNKQLANHFNVSVRSVENWRRNLLNKLGVETIPELTRWVVRLEDFGLLPPR